MYGKNTAKWKRILAGELSDMAINRMIGILLLFGIFFTIPIQADKVGMNCKRVDVAGLTKTYACQGLPKGIEKTTLTLHLDRFSIPAEWSDPGDSYEIKTTVWYKVYSDAASSVLLSEGYTDWGKKDYRKYNVWSEDRWSYKLGLNLVLKDVPLNGKVEFRIQLVEHDTGADDWIIFEPKGYRTLDILVYPSRNIAILERMPASVISFGKTKRLTGTAIAKEDVSGTLDLTITQKKDIKVGGVINRQSQCDQYGSKSVLQYEEAKKLHCPFNYNMATWSNNKDEHSRWCMHGNNFKMASDSIRRREKELENCRKTHFQLQKNPGQVLVTPAANKAKIEQTCKTYALDAVTLNHEAQQYHCNFKPPVWSNDYKKHFNWCIHGNNHTFIIGENNKRKNALQKCKTQKTNNSNTSSATQYCQIYAQDAINQYSVYQQRHCGPGGLGWSLDYNAHLNWCIKAYKKGDLAVIVNETARRNAILANCK